MAYDIEMIKKVYGAFPQKVEQLRKLVNRPLTLTEKVLYAHLSDTFPTVPFGRGVSYVKLFT